MEQVIDNPIEDQPPLRTASNGARIGNYFIDLISFYILLVILIVVSGTTIDENNALLPLEFIFIYVLYMTIFEALFAKTPGKFVTRTRVVTETGERPDFINILGRNLCRLIPFDALSFLFASTGWHDSVSRTRVVYDVRP